MQLHVDTAKLAGIRSYAVPVRCPYCNDWMVAPTSSEFVESGEIRHHWQCETCGQSSSTVIDLAN